MLLGLRPKLSKVRRPQEDPQKFYFFLEFSVFLFCCEQLFHSTQEALRNVWRHSKATQAEVMVEFDERKTRVTVSDTGKGFNLPETIGDLARDGKLGLAGMQERARLLSGTLTVQSQLGRGPSITVEIPA